MHAAIEASVVAADPMQGWAVVEGKKSSRVWVSLDPKAGAICTAVSAVTKAKPKALLKLDKQCETVVSETGGGLRVVGKRGKTLLVLRFEDEALGRRWHQWLHGRFKGLTTFATPLVELAAREGLVEDEHRLPEFLEVLFARLSLDDACKDTHGIFRVSGGKDEIASMRALLDDTAFRAAHAVPRMDPTAAAGLLKLFIKELPEPVCTNQLYPYFLQYGSAEVPLEQGRFMLHNLVFSLPPVHRVFLHRVVKLMLAVAANASANDMSLRNLAIVFAPSVFRPPAGSGPAIEMRDTPRMLSAMLRIAQEMDFVFTPWENQEKDPFIKALNLVARSRQDGAVEASVPSSKGSPPPSPPPAAVADGAQYDDGLGGGDAHAGAHAEEEGEEEEGEAYDWEYVPDEGFGEEEGGWEEEEGYGGEEGGEEEAADGS